VLGMLELDRLLQHTIDSLKAIEYPKIIYPFNPNFINDQRGYFLDLSPQEIDRLHANRKQGKWINSVRDFLKVTGVDSTWLHTYSTFFNFPSRVIKKHKKPPKKSFSLIDLNAATADQLEQIYGIGEVLSQLIIRYRERLKGFATETQLSQVYGLSPEVVSRLQNRCSIITQPTFKKIALQEASVEELSKTPYLSYVEARKIVRLRTELKGMHFSSLN
jgi:competence protein ComEA